MPFTSVPRFELASRRTGLRIEADLQPPRFLLRPPHPLFSPLDLSLSLLLRRVDQLQGRLAALHYLVPDRLRQAFAAFHGLDHLSQVGIADHARFVAKFHADMQSCLRLYLFVIMWSTQSGFGMERMA